MAKHAKAVICPASESFYVVCGARVFLLSFGHLWELGKEGIPIVHAGEGLKRVWADDQGDILVEQADGVFYLERVDGKGGLAKAKTKKAVPKKAPQVYGEWIYSLDDKRDPVSTHTVKHADGRLAFEVSGRYLEFLGHCGGDFVFRRHSPREIFAADASGREQVLYPLDESAYTQWIDGRILVSTQLPGSRARCDVYGVKARAVIQSVEIEADSEGFYDLAEIGGAWAFMWAGRLYLLDADGMKPAFSGQKVDCYLAAQEGVYAAFAREPALHLHDNLLAQQAFASLHIPLNRFWLLSLGKYLDGVVCSLYPAGRLSGLGYVFLSPHALAGDATEVACEEPSFTTEKRHAEGDSGPFTCVVNFADKLPFDTLVRHALAAVDEVFAHYSEKNAETLSFNGTAEVAVDGEGLSRQQKSALAQACDRMAERYFFRRSPVTDEAYNVRLVWRDE
jgi:hypothetical protein